MAILHTTQPHPPVSYRLDEARLLDLNLSLLQLEAENLSRTQLTSGARRDSLLLEELGAEAFELLFPEPIRSALRSATPTTLYLQLDERLIPFPWECAFDGRRFLSTTFEVARQTFTLGAEGEAATRRTKSGPLEILLLIEDHAEAELAAQSFALQARTRGDQRFNLKVRSSSELSAADLEEAATQYSLLHFVGWPSVATSSLPAAGWRIGEHLLTPSDLSRGSSHSKLFLSEVCEPSSRIETEALDAGTFVRACCAGNLSHIVNFSPVPHACRMDFASKLYTGLAQGKEIGLAVTEARRTLHERFGAAWSGYQFYGEPTTRLVSPRPQKHIQKAATVHARRSLDSFSENRQLTVMFCDLVGSTPMSQQLDLEDWQAILKLYQDKCTGILNKHGGQIHEYKGDGLVIYFGFPTAYEDSAQRALRAGIEISQSVNEIFSSVSDLLRRARLGNIQLRIAVHTGPVVIGEMGDRLTATGLTLAYAERLQHAAPPNSVVISKDTHQLVKNRFEFEHLGQRTLKGISTPCEVYRVIREAETRAQKAPISTPNHTLFIGRADEMNILLDEWQVATQCRRRVVLISGDAGIGKSRLIREFSSSLADQEVNVFEYRCSPYHQNTALYPIIQSLEIFLNFDRTLSDKEKLGLIEQAIPQSMSAATVVPVIASMLSVEYTPRYPKLRDSPDKQKQVTRDTLVHWTEIEAERKPICILVEDIHWIDPSTLELLQTLIASASNRPILLVLTYRTEGNQTWTCPFEARPITLGRLAKDSVLSLIESIPGGSELPSNMMGDLIDRTDGVPCSSRSRRRWPSNPGLDRDQRAVTTNSAYRQRSRICSRFGWIVSDRPRKSLSLALRLGAHLGSK